MNRRTIHPRRGRSGTAAGLPLLGLALLALALTACGGGGGGGLAPVGGPTDLTYQTPDALYRVDGTIAPNDPVVVGGTADSFGVSPALPAGLDLDPDTGVISGTPTQVEPRREYTVTASGGGGPISGSLWIEVRYPKSNSLVPEASIDEAALRHFLVRTHWGVTTAKLDELHTKGLSAFLDDMLTFPAAGSQPFEQQAALLLRRTDDPPGQEGMFPYHYMMIRWWIQLMKENPNPFQEVLAFMWHDHFATSSEVLGGGRNYYMVDHVNMLREKAAGNLRDFLLAVLRDWAMLWWLDGRVNTKYAPNENCAREWFELFTLGVDNGYDQADIEETARALTGWQDLVLDEDTGLRHMQFVASRHDTGDKTILGVTVPGQDDGHDDFEAVVNLTTDQGQVAEWIARRLLKSFCNPDPAPELIDQLAAVLRGSSYELAPTLKAMFLSEAFFAEESRGTLIKSPVDHAMGFMRSTGLWVRVNEVQSILTSQGNVPTQPPTVDGWPGGSQWLAAQAMVDRANFLQLANSHSRALEEQQAKGTDLTDLLPSGTPTSVEVVDALADRLGVTLTPGERTRLAEYLDTERLGDGTVVASPFDPTDPDHIDERVRGLLYVLGQHPTYMVR